MPTYGYRCTACGHTFERIQKITDPALTECENCGAPVKKILYPVGISFKGSGFYVNDYSKASASSGNSGEAKSDSTPEAKPAETKSDSTPAPAEAKPTPSVAAPTTS